jgi:hypothetical protein
MHFGSPLRTSFTVFAFPRIKYLRSLFDWITKKTKITIIIRLLDLFIIFIKLFKKALTT